MQVKQSLKKKKKNGVVVDSSLSSSGAQGGLGLGVGGVAMMGSSPEEEAGQIIEIAKHFNPQPLVYQDSRGGWNSLEVRGRVREVDLCGSLFLQF